MLLYMWLFFCVCGFVCFAIGFNLMFRPNYFASAFFAGSLLFYALCGLYANNITIEYCEPNYSEVRTSVDPNCCNFTIERVVSGFVCHTQLLQYPELALMFNGLIGIDVIFIILSLYYAHFIKKKKAEEEKKK